MKNGCLEKDGRGGKMVEIPVKKPSGPAGRQMKKLSHKIGHIPEAAVLLGTHRQYPAAVRQGPPGAAAPGPAGPAGPGPSGQPAQKAGPESPPGASVPWLSGAAAPARPQKLPPESRSDAAG